MLLHNMSDTAKLAVFWRVIGAFANHSKNDAKFRAANENPKARNKPVHYWAVPGMIRQWAVQLQHVDDSELTTSEFVDQLQQFRVIVGDKLPKAENWRPSHDHFGTKSNGWAKYELLHPAKHLKAHCAALMLAKEQAGDATFELAEDDVVRLLCALCCKQILLTLCHSVAGKFHIPKATQEDS